MEPNQLLALFKRGLIPGPGETDEAFLRRVESHAPLPFPEWKEMAAPLMEKCGFSIDWVPITYSSKRLFPWEGAVFWMQENGQSLLQLRSSLRAKKLLGNTREEILTHEAVHAAREAFHEPKFEEFLAYATSRASWKHWVGPFFMRPWEFPLFATALFALPLLPWISAPLLLIFFGRFFKRLFLFYRLKKTTPFPILLCLTDQEIEAGAVFSSGNPSLRLQLIEQLKALYSQLNPN